MIDAYQRQPRDSFAKKFDAEASLGEARARLPLKKLMEQHGLAPEGGRWKSFTCPFCRKKGKASVYESSGQEWFRCFFDSCPSRGEHEAMEVVGMMAYVGNFSRKDAFVVYLKEAGVWKDRAKFKGPKDAKDAPAQAAQQSAGGMVAGESSAQGEVGPAETPPATPPLSPPMESRPVSPAATGQIQEEDGHAENADDGVSGSATQDVQVHAGDDADVASNFPATVVASTLPGSTPENEIKDSSDPTPPHASSEVASPTVPPAQAASGEAAGNGEVNGEAKPAPVKSGLDVIREFYGKLTLSEADEEALWVKRGLTSETIAALGFRSNTKPNKAILEEIAKVDGFDREVLLESGLWKRKGTQIGISGQYYGAGRIRQLGPGERPEQGQWKDEDDWLWGWTQPVLIPYVDVDGRVVSLRPHKGMAAAGTVAGTPQPYIPRPVRTAEEGDRGRAWEFFHSVVITEGEFKAAALWQILGAGRKDGRKPFGVVALPGISFSRHYETRERLNEYLRKSKADRVIVVFDNEEKGDPALPGFKQDWRKRHDAEIHARYLATDIHQKLRLHTRVGNIPNECRDEKGKADWDGMMARIAQTQETAES